ncbi:unnamed protein product [Cuscuta epithymum]|uniref:Myb/SANT-like DNA-binding domain-containing protein n=1 Tax=Cuscuta epithymum TaxID=186058 RepID=A0AAV0FS47_9ASTE|nr:unnamed protein product [Cuscuta epithymum]CAH9138417.1 unnamed protein product [Cuscuta epithymum]
MEPSGMYPSMGSGMLGLEMSLHDHIPPQQQQPKLTMVPIDHHSHSVNVHTYGNKPNIQGLSFNSDKDEPAGTGGPTADQSGAEDGKKKMSPWQRMKWTDEMVRLLIMVVYYIGDEGAPEGNNTHASSEKKGSHGGGILQKKGKWKSVSRAMMERGFYVSPQQCEDKFNDLNKRYKRVIDILGKGTACRVVENQSLLETMDLSPKMKEEAKKLLNSKHLFFREMCAYHNSCSHGGGASGGGVGEFPSDQPNPHQQQQRKKCLHSSDGPRVEHNLGRAETEEAVKARESREEEEDDEEEEEEESNDDEDDESETEEQSRKRQRTDVIAHQLNTEWTNMCQDGNKSVMEKRHWIKGRIIQLEEHRVMYETEKLELRKQQLQWEKYRSRKERGMERERLANERKILESERMVLLLQQKEMELLDHQRTSDPSSVTG